MPEYLVELIERQVAERKGTTIITADSQQDARRFAEVADDDEIDWGAWQDPPNSRGSEIYVSEVYTVGKLIRVPVQQES